MLLLVDFRSHFLHAVRKRSVFQFPLGLFLYPSKHIRKHWLDMAAYNAFIIRILMKIKHMDLLCLCNRLLNPEQRKLFRLHE